MREPAAFPPDLRDHAGGARDLPARGRRDAAGPGPRWRCGHTFLRHPAGCPVRACPGRPVPLTIGPRTFAWGSRTFVMGILNVTPDLFSGDGLIAAAG